MLHQDVDASGVLKLNSKMLQSSQLRKLDKQEKGFLAEVVREGKGERNGGREELGIYHNVFCALISHGPLVMGPFGHRPLGHGPLGHRAFGSRSLWVTGPLVHRAFRLPGL